MDILTARNLYLWAKDNNTRISQLEDWQTSALEKIVSGGGKDVVNTSGNGVSVTFASGMSNQDWFNTVSAAIGYINNGVPSNTKQGILR